MKKILLILLCIVWLLEFSDLFAQVDLGAIDWRGLDDRWIISGSDISNAGFTNNLVAIFGRILRSLKIIINGLAIFALLYVGAILVSSFGNDTAISEGKKKFSYTLIALVFINIPETIYRILTGSDYTSDRLAKVRTAGISVRDNASEIADTSGRCNLFFCPETFFSEAGEAAELLKFIDIALVGVAIVMFTYGALRLMIGGGDEEVKKVQRRRFFYWLIALMVLGFIRTIYEAIFLGGLVGSEDSGAFLNVANLLLFLAAPIAIVFMIIGAYQIITSGGSEERLGRWKRIMFNTFLAVILLLLSYTFVIEISGGLTNTL